MSTALLPNLIVPGAGKAGTSSLHLYLGQHPDVEMSSVKEPHIFSSPDYDSSALAGYAGLFAAGAANATFRGESSTGYLLFPRVPERVAAAVPDCRLIFVLRNPIDRAISHYRWLVALGEVRSGFRSAFESDRALVPDPLSSSTGNYGYIFQEGCYGAHLARFSNHFSTDQIHLLETAELRATPDVALLACWDFLNLAPVDLTTRIEANRTTPMPHPRVRAWIEGRSSLAVGHRRRARSIAKRLIGSEGAQRIREAALRRLGTSEVPVPIDVDRRWLAASYESDVATLRERFPRFRDTWTDDFPN